MRERSKRRAYNRRDPIPPLLHVYTNFLEEDPVAPTVCKIIRQISHGMSLIERSTDHAVQPQQLASDSREREREEEEGRDRERQRQKQ